MFFPWLITACLGAENGFKLVFITILEPTFHIILRGSTVSKKVKKIGILLVVTTIYKPTFRKKKRGNTASNKVRKTGNFLVVTTTYELEFKNGSKYPTF